MNTTISQPQDKKNVGKAVFAAVLVVCLCIAGVFAYLTATDTKVNHLSIANELDIEVVEPNWNPDAAKNLEPRNTVTKDPAIHNLTDIPAYVFAEVEVPRYTDNDGAKHDLFTYRLSNPSDWTYMGKIDNGETVTYRYEYFGVLSGDETTSSIFDEVTVADFRNLEVSVPEQLIIVTGHAIQAEGFENVHGAWDAYFADKGDDNAEGYIVKGEFAAENDAFNQGEQYFMKGVSDGETVSDGESQKDGSCVFELDFVQPEPVEDYVIEDVSGSEIMNVTVGVTTDEYGNQVFYDNGEPDIFIEDGSKYDDKERANFTLKPVEFKELIAPNTQLIDFSNDRSSEGHAPVYDLSMYETGTILGYQDGEAFCITTNGASDTVYAPEDCTNMFAYLNNVHIELHMNLDTSSTTSMEGMFRNCSQVYLNLYDGAQPFDCSKVNNMDYLFYMSNGLSVDGVASWWDNNGGEPNPDIYVNPEHNPASIIYGNTSISAQAPWIDAAYNKYRSYYRYPVS